MDVLPHSTNLPAPRSVLHFHFPYRPSNALCYGLIFWTVFCIMGNTIFPWLGAFFALTTYGPTIHFAIQCIVQNNRGSYEVTDNHKLGHRASTLTAVWALTIIACVYFWWNERMFPEIFVVVVPPGTQATVIMLYIALRSAWEKHITRSPGLPSTQTGNEATLHGTDTESQPLLSSGSQLSIYRPSKTLLVVSIMTILGSWGTQTLYLVRSLQRRGFDIAWAFILLWPCIPLILLQLYTLRRSLRGSEPTLHNEGGIGNYAIDLVAMVIALQLLVAIGNSPQHRGLYIPGVIQGFLSVYIAARYMWSISKVTPYYAQLIRGNTSQFSTPHSHPPSDVAGYNPSLMTALTWLTLSALCIYFEAPKEPAIGLPMTVIVYIPTIIFCILLLRPREAHTVDSIGPRKTADWALQLACLWIASHLFYLLFWPLGQQFVAKVMNPYIRGAAVALSIYVAIGSSYGIGSREGAISVPQPDVDDRQDIEHRINPIDVSNINVATRDSAQPSDAES